MTAAGSGRLVLIATPIGHLGDLSPRAVGELGAAAAVVCEDTRRTGRLLVHAGVRAPRLLVANEHTEAGCAAEVRRLLDDGATVAVVTDAGTPGISDPGSRLVRAALEGGHTVLAVPGPSALLAALVISGLPTDRFVMEGFLPRSGSERARRLAVLTAEPRTIVLYEAPHRLARTLADLVVACGPARPVAVARELTKLHEEVRRGTLGDAASHAASNDAIGEHVIVLGGAPAALDAGDDELRAALTAARTAGRSRRDAVADVASAYGASRRRVYELQLALGRDAHDAPGT